MSNQHSYDEVGQPWTGRLPFDVFTTAGHPLGQGEMRVWRDVVDVWMGDRCLAVLPRHEIHDWIVGGCVDAYRRHDVGLLMVEDRLAIELGEQEPAHRLPTEVVAQLRRL